MKRHFQAVLFLLIILAYTLIQPMPALANQSSYRLERLYGNTRFQTMQQIALQFPQTVDNVVLATGNNFPDALAGVPLAHQKGGPLLLLDSTPELSQDAFNYLNLHVNRKGNIYILGGTAVVPEGFETALVQLGFAKENIHRLAGQDCYETALAIARELQHQGSEFYLVQGDNFPDALSASVLAATTGYVSVEKANYLKSMGETVTPSAGGVPLILLPSKGPVPEAVVNYLNSIPDGAQALTQTFHVVGGTAVIPESELQQLQAQVRRIAPDGLTRISGETRYGTMSSLNSLDLRFDASWQNDGLGAPIPQVYLASGENFPDALTGAVLAAREDAPLVLINDSLPQETLDLLMGYWYRNQKGVNRGSTITALGGSGIISDTTLEAASYVLNYGKTLAQLPLVQNFAGSGSLGYLDGKNQEAEFAMPSGLVQGNDGAVYVADTQNHRIRGIAGGKVFTVAGVTDANDEYGIPVGGYLDGPAGQAKFNQPKGLAMDQMGNLLVADSGNGAIRKISPTGQVTTLVKGLNSPSDIAADKDGQFYVSDTLNHRILRVDEAGKWSVLAGGGYETRYNWLFGGYADGKGELAQFNEPSGLALGPEGDLYVADTGNQKIRKVTPHGDVTTVAGSSSIVIPDTTYFKGGFQDGPALMANFNFPSGLAVSSEGTVYVADTYNHRLRVIDKTGEVKTLAGSGIHGKQNGFSEQVEFDCPFAVTIDKDGNLLIVDQVNNSIRSLKFRP